MTELIRLSEWAKRNGVSRMTAWRMATSGRIKGARLSASDTWVVEVESTQPSLLTVAYARVSSHDQKTDLDRQVARIAEWAAANGIHIDRYVREVGSGLSEKRRELASLLSDPTIGTIIVEHRDRLARFGVAQLELAMAATHRKVLVVDPKENEDDLVRDMLDLLTCFSARLYGRRSARNRAARALEAMQPKAVIE